MEGQGGGEAQGVADPQKTEGVITSAKVSELKLKFDFSLKYCPRFRWLKV
jgi:hypothetical protein